MSNILKLGGDYMTRKDKLLLSNIVFILTSLIAVSMFFVKISEHPQIITTVSFEDLFTLLSPMLLIVIFSGLLNIIIGNIIIYGTVFIILRKIEFKEKYRTLITKKQLSYQLYNHKTLCVFRC